ncbi:TRAP transporter small permease subunit [Octadecabacter sp. SW4]|uniref:TRAP transporter small permease subunit n=1 Tax=Octadecabacter sp. SW4 TaxID=2602067 RepID=UPI001C301AD8|nr:TRAP transporter small permease subunit [Octadecabacter sp. SW4]
MLHRFMMTLATGMALLGGVVLLGLIAIVGISVLGLQVNGFGHLAWVETTAPRFAAWLLGTGVGPLTGDYELVAAGAAFAVFAFLPICQITGGHATVDLLADRFSQPVRRALTAFWEVVLAAALILIAARLTVGTLDKLGNGETSYLIQFPLWWSYAASSVAAWVAALVGIYCAGWRIAQVRG